MKVIVYEGTTQEFKDLGLDKVIRDEASRGSAGGGTKTKTRRRHLTAAQAAKEFVEQNAMPDLLKNFLRILHENHPDAVSKKEVDETLGFEGAELRGVLGAVGRRKKAVGTTRTVVERTKDDDGNWTYSLTDPLKKALDDAKVFE